MPRVSLKAKLTLLWDVYWEGKLVSTDLQEQDAKDLRAFLESDPGAGLGPNALGDRVPGLRWFLSGRKPFRDGPPTRVFSTPHGNIVFSPLVTNLDEQADEPLDLDLEHPGEQEQRLIRRPLAPAEPSVDGSPIQSQDLRDVHAGHPKKLP